jgi:hypothetical protein
LAVSSLGSGLVRLICFFKRNEIIQFYSRFSLDVSEAVGHSFSYELDDVQRTVKEARFAHSVKQSNKALQRRRIWILMGLSFVASVVPYTLISLYVTIVADDPQLQTWGWKIIGAPGLVLSSLDSIFSATLMWLGSITGCIGVAFNALLEEFKDKSKYHDMILYQKTANVGKLMDSDWLDSSGMNSASYFMKTFTRLKELTDNFNETFKHVLIINMGGLCCLWVMYVFTLITNIYLFNHSLKIVIPVFIMVVLISNCHNYKWFISNASQELHKQVSFFNTLKKLYFMLLMGQVNQVHQQVQETLSYFKELEFEGISPGMRQKARNHILCSDIFNKGFLTVSNYFIFNLIMKTGKYVL